jgi:predicted ribosomally synthesized peptide with nif11-like leader
MGVALGGSAERHCRLGDNGWQSFALQTMSEEQLKAFLEAVKADAGLQEQLKAAGDADAVVAIAKAAGFVITAEELKRAQAEISEDELEGVAGGVTGLPCVIVA